MKSKLLITYCILHFSFLISYSQVINTIAGTGTAAYNGDNIAAVTAQVNLPTSICRDYYGNIYIADRFNHRVRKIDTVGVITTIAGTGTSGFSGDNNLATLAKLNQPIGVMVANDGTVYISDNGNNRVRKIDAAGIITTYAGTGIAGFNGDNMHADSAKLNAQWGLCLDKYNNLYIADRNNNRVRKVDYATGIITTVAGTGTAGYSGEGLAANTAQFNHPIAVCIDTALTLYIADEDNNRVRKVTYATGIVNKIAGTGTASYNGDGISATSAQLNKPCGVAVDLLGNVYISDRVNQRLRKINTSGTISTIAGTGIVGFSGDGLNPAVAKINYPRELFSDGSGNIYFADTDNDRIRKITYCSLPSIPTLNASSTLICNGTSVTLSIATGSLNDATQWQWYSGSCGGTPVSTGASVTVNPAVTTTYFARGTGGCSTPYACGSITITVAQPTIGIFAANACDSYTLNSTTYTSSGIYTQNLSNVAGCDSTLTLNLNINNTTSNSISTSACDSYTLNSTTYTSSGTYTQTLANAAGCDSILTINLAITSSTNNSIAPIACDSYTLNAITYTTSGTYTQNFTNAAGCDSTLIINLTINTVNVSTSVADNTITAAASGANYQWLNCNTGNSFIPGETNQSFTATVNGNYAVMITDNGCVDTSACLNILLVGISETNEQQINIFPNPFSSQTTITFGTEQKNTIIKIKDILGKEIKTINFTGKQLVIDKTEMKAGVYFVQTTDEKKNLTSNKIIIQ